MTGLAGRGRWTRSKYGNTRVKVDGIAFDSKGEAAHWQLLRLRERAGEISDLKRQVAFRLDVNGQHICRMVPDFAYVEGGRQVVADFKSPATITPEFKLKCRLMKAVHGIDVQIVGRK